MTDRRIVLNTQRTYLYKLDIDDASSLFILNSDPEVIKYTGDPAFSNEKEAEKFLAAYSDYTQNGIGRWGVRQRLNDEFIGWCGLKLHQNGEVDLGFRFLKRYWGHGFATEASLACVAYGFSKLNLDYIIGRVMHKNLASIRVLEKVGMSYWKDIICDEHPAKCYRINRPENQ
jgi:[ribosomal protein S5]-alanine N-acetyltransferase